MTNHFVDTTKMVSLSPLPELVYRLRDEAPYGNLDGETKRELHLIDAAYRAGADAELEACCEWLANARNHALSWEEATNYSANLRAARRPKPPSLKELALALISHDPENQPFLSEEGIAVIRRALESLPD